MLNLKKCIRTIAWCGLVLSLSKAKAQTHLVQDISTYAKGITEGLITGAEIANVNGVVYFTANNYAHGAELWKTDGTADGTVLVKDIVAGPGGSQPNKLTSAGNTLYFTADDGIHGRELWKTDGTTAGTVMVSDIYPQGGSGDPYHLTFSNGLLFFTANEPQHGAELWKTDGTAGGTAMIKDIYQGVAGSFAQRLVDVNGVVFFTATNSNNGYELWKSNGTEGGTVMVKDINPGGSSSSPDQLTAIDGVLYFNADNGTQGRELWKSNGTDAGTVMIKDILVNNSSSPSHFVKANNVIFFAAYTPATGNELWKTDGTAAGTVLVKDINTGQNSGMWVFQDQWMLAVNGIVYFSASDNASGVELWRSDGTEAGTTMVKNIAEGSASSYPKYLTAYNGSFFFSANDRLWKSDGTEAGTALCPIAEDFWAHPEHLLNVDGRIYFIASDGVHGTELWRNDGTPSSNAMVKDIATGTEDSDFNGFAVFQGKMYFSLGYYLLGETDGTASGTVQNYYLDLVPNPSSSADCNVALSTTDWIYFTGYFSNTYHIFKTKGEIGDAVQISVNGFKSINPKSFVLVNNAIYFTADDGTHGTELWKTDGTAGSAVMVKDIKSGASGSNPNFLRNINGKLFFAANDGINGEELWRSDDGTTAGTVMVKDIYPGSESSYPNEIFGFNGAIYFSAINGTHGRELWKSDGTQAGTNMLKDLNPGDNGSWSSPNTFAALNNVLCFNAYHPEYGFELWKTDGTAEGTVVVKDISEGLQSGFPDNLTALNGTLYFSATDAAHGYELWKSDGTAQGTTIVADLTPGPDGTNDLVRFLAYDNKVFFLAKSRIWKTEGGVCNTVALTDSAQVAVTEELPFTVVDNKMYFVGVNEETGNELYFYDFSNANTGACMQTITFNDLPEHILGEAPFELEASSTSGLPVSFTSSNNNVATINGKTITLKAEGETVITASQHGDNNYAAATPIAHTLTVKLITEAESGMDQAVEVYPNPASSYIIVKNEVSHHGVAPRVTDINGKSHQTQMIAIDDYTYQVDVSSLPVGIYFVQVRQRDQRTVTRKVVKR